MKLPKQMLMRYILGTCTKEEQRRVESAYFADPAVLRSMTAVTDELVNLYVTDSMSSPLRKRFEHCLQIKPYLRQKVDRARAAQKKYAGRK